MSDTGGYGVLARSVRRLRPRQWENEATEALAHVVAMSAAAKTALMRQLAEADGRLSSLGPLHFRTQQQDKDTGAQTDLEGVDDLGRVQVIVEVKLGAGLHGDQLTSYLRHFGGGPGTLVLLVPTPRRDVIWGAVLRKVDGLQPLPGQAYRATTPQGHAVALLTWAPVLDDIDRALAESSPRLRSDVEQLRGLLAFSEDVGFRPLQPDELADVGWPRRWLDYTRLLELTISKIESEPGLAPSFRNPPTNRRLKVLGGSGWHMSAFVTSRKVWGRFQVNAEYWLKSGQGPFFAAFPAEGEPGKYVKEALGPWLRDTPPRAHTSTDESWIFVPLAVPVDVDEDEVIKELAAELGRAVATVDATVPAAVKVAPPADVEEEAGPDPTAT